MKLPKLRLGWTWRRVLHRIGLILALVAVVAETGPSQALPFGLGGSDNSAEANVCAAERAPILARKRQYDALRRSQIAAAVGEGVKQGGLFLAGALAQRYGLGGLFNHGDSNPTPPAADASGGGLGGLLSVGSLGQAAQLQIPGVTLAANGGALGRPVSANDPRAIAAMAVVVAIVGSVEAYVRLKAQAANGDAMRLAQSIDDDAGLQIDVSRSIDAEEQALAACRARQVADLSTHLASASNNSDRSNIAHQRSRLNGAIQQDVDLTGGVVDQQAALAKTFTQGRAMSENKSEADVLGGQAPAYEATASTTPLKLPDAALTPPLTPISMSTTPTPPPIVGYVTVRDTVVRATPSPKGKRLEILKTGAAVQPLQDPDGVWVAFDVGGGAKGYVRLTDLTKPPAPTLAEPNNIREHNKAVLAARDDGPNRLKSLMTDVQARHRRESQGLLAFETSVDQAAWRLLGRG